MKKIVQIIQNFKDALTRCVEICRIAVVFIDKGLLLRNSRQDQTSIFMGRGLAFFILQGDN